MTKRNGFLSFSAFTLLASLLISCNHNGASGGSGSDFEGVVTYGVSADSKLSPEMSSMFNTMVMKTYVKGTKTRTEEAMTGSKNVVIADSKDPDSPVVLIDMFGGKYAIKQTDSLKKLAEQNAPKIEYIDSANSGKEIAGYKCKKARCTMNISNMGPITSEIYYTEDLPYADPQGTFKGLKGMPMQYSMNMGNINIVLCAKSVDKQKLSDSLFVIPAEYKVMTIRELQDAMAQQMSKSMGGDSASQAMPDTSKGTK